MQRAKKRKPYGSAVVEMAAFAFAIIGFLLLPFGDMVAMLAGFGFSQAQTEFVAQESAKSSSLSSLQTNLVNSSNRFNNVGLSKLLGVKPVGGYQQSGSDFYIVETNIYTGKETYYGPNSCPTVVDQSSNNYELCVKSKFGIGPVFSLPYLGSAPGFSIPAVFNFGVFKPIEHLNELIASQNSQGLANGSTGLSGNSADWLGRATLSQFFFPRGGAPCLMPGQVVLAQNTVNVYAINPGWTDAGVSVQKGQRISMRLLNAWNQNGPVNWIVNGQPSMYWGDGQKSANNSMSIGALVTKIGTKGASFYLNPASNMVAQATGEIYFQCNDVNYANNGLCYQVQVQSTSN